MTSSKLKVALAASLALNLFIVGAVAGAAGMQARLSKKVPESSTRGNASALMRAAEVLPEGKREQYHARLKAEGEKAQADFRAARAARVKASALIAAPNYDQSRIAALLAAPAPIPTGLLASDYPLFAQHDGDFALGQTQRGGGPDDASAHDHHIGRGRGAPIRGHYIERRQRHGKETIL